MTPEAIFRVSAIAGVLPVFGILVWASRRMYRFYKKDEDLFPLFVLSLLLTGAAWGMIVGQTGFLLAEVTK